MSDNTHEKDIDQVSGVETTGHEWDGIKELNNPAPRWWVWVWIVCIIYAVGYWFVYPTWPTAWPGFGSGQPVEKTGSVTRVTTGATEGSFGWDEYKKLGEEQKEIDLRQEKYLAGFQQASYEEIMKDPELHAFAIAGGNATFKDNCALCHGAGGAGAKGFPNLNDDDWLWGGTIEDIDATIRYGIRSGHGEARDSLMPSFGKDEVLSKEEIDAVVDYVLALSGAEKQSTYDQGAEVYANNCASCHGDDAKGGRDFGAPNLADAIWLYGGDRADVYNTVFNAHAGVMPAWIGKLSEDRIRQVAVYVHELGGGESSFAPAQAQPVAEEAAPVAEEAAEEGVSGEGEESSASPAEESAPAPVEEGTAPEDGTTSE
jgi:cytochrome c oxidase cbb3-type subunit 3